ncbi:hypothetical protein GCM10010191_01750 [Actinomadura vinacea]|uniref:Uncharacterized protein n=1 Tax=Actinomadura vinacea TaxID=115336 RepID=A0ABN3IB37_9ACTN
MSLTDADIAAALAPAGLRFIERERAEVKLPLQPNRSAASSLAEHGRIDAEPDEVVDVDDSDMAAKLNASWLRLALQYGLFDEQREFLIGVDFSATDEPDWAWVRVRLLDEWDIAGSGVATLRSNLAGVFTTRFVPEFTSVSLDRRMLLHTTVWGNGTVSSIVIRPDLVKGNAN